MIKRREALEIWEWLIRPWVPDQASAIIRLGNLLSRSGVGLGSYGKEECLRFFHNYYEHCRINLSARNYIDFKVQDGWEPLCRHLGVPVPERKTPGGWVQEPFPQVNDRDAFGIWTANLQRKLMAETRRNIIIHGLVLFGLMLLLAFTRHFLKVD